MIFTYSDYKEVVLTFPLIKGIISFVILLIFVFVLYNTIKKGEKITLYITFGTIVPLLFVLSSLFQLQYGIHLFFESENDAIVFVGEIESIDDVFHSPRYYYEEKAVYASIVTIDGLELYFMTSGDLSVGDYVEIKYLPRSTFVLEVELVEEIPQDD